MPPNGQAQGSSGWKNNPIKADAEAETEAEAEVREQCALDIFESVLCQYPFSFTFRTHTSFVFFCYHLSY